MKNINGSLFQLFEILAGHWRSLNDKKNQLKYDRSGYHESMSLSSHHKNRKINEI